MKEHIFSTHNNLVVNYDLKLEEFEIDLDYLLGDIKESEILNFLENDTEEKPVSIQDVKKKFHLRTLSKGIHATKYMSYSVIIGLALVMILILAYCSKQLIWRFKTERRHHDNKKPKINNYLTLLKTTDHNIELKTADSHDVAEQNNSSIVETFEDPIKMNIKPTSKRSSKMKK